MAGKSTYLENALLNWAFKNSAFPAVPTIKIHLFTTAPTDDAAGTEVGAGIGYTAKTTAVSDWTTSTTGQTSNATILNFGTASASWGTVTHFEIRDSSGNRLWNGTLTTPRTISATDSAQFGIGAFVINED